MRNLCASPCVRVYEAPHTTIEYLTYWAVFASFETPNHRSQSEYGEPGCPVEAPLLRNCRDLNESLGCILG